VHLGAPVKIPTLLLKEQHLQAHQGFTAFVPQPLARALRFPFACPARLGTLSVQARMYGHKHSHQNIW
jgi:hypothetical protein